MIIGIIVSCSPISAVKFQVCCLKCLHTRMASASGLTHTQTVGYKSTHFLACFLALGYSTALTASLNTSRTPSCSSAEHSR